MKGEMMKQKRLTQVEKGSRNYYNVYIGENTESSITEMVSALLKLPYIVSAYPGFLVKGCKLPISIQIDPRFEGNLSESLENFAVKQMEES